MVNFKLGESNVKMKSACHERRTKKKSESPTGFEPMTSQTLGGHSIHLSYNTDILLKIGFLATGDDYRAALKGKTQTSCPPII